MSSGELTSRERVLRALHHQRVDHIPCCFMSFTALRQRVGEDMFKLALAEREMGLDSMLFIPAASRAQRPDHPDLRGLPVRISPRVEVREWREDVPGTLGVLHKEYYTPDGVLSTGVRLSEDWPYGDHIPLVGDYQIPRATKPLITSSEELRALEHLLILPQRADVEQFLREAETARSFVAEHDLLLAGGWGVGMDMANWLCGMESLMAMTVEQPGFVSDLLEMIHQWNMARMKVVLAASVDLYIRRAWYEGCDFVTPRFFRSAILPRLKREVELAHEHGAKFGYICTSGVAPMLDFYLEAGFDVLIGVDPIQDPRADLGLLKRTLGGRVALWGGVSGAVTVERGSAEEVRAAVRAAIATLGPTGFILSPVDNITVDEPRTWENLEVFIAEWRQAW